VLLLNRSLMHGGTERQVTATAIALDRNLFEPHVAFVESGFRELELRQAGIPLLQLPLNSYVNRTAWRSAAILRSYIRKHGIRLVHTFDFAITIFGVPACSLLKGTVVLSSQRCYFPLVPARHRWLLHLAHRMAKGIVVNAEALRRHMMEEHGYDGARIHVCPNGIDIEQFSPEPRRRIEGLEDAALVIGVACVLRPEKNLGALMDAFARVARDQPGVRLLVVGSGPEREPLENQARALGVERQCVFRPSVASVAECLRSIDVFVHPSHSEALPNAIMEAMACGCCVLSSNVGGSPEVVVDGESGLLFAAGDRETLAGQLRATMEDAGLRRRLAQAGVERIRTRFTMPLAARRMEQIYLSYLKSPI
jgi:L-malate glycosyltransferase